MKTLSLVVILTALLGCGSYPNEYVVRGTVRNVVCRDVCGIVFQHDTGEVTVITVRDIPPVWVGYRCQLTLQSGGTFDTLESVSKIEDWEW
jgi:hypothetical protein